MEQIKAATTRLATWGHDLDQIEGDWDARPATSPLSSLGRALTFRNNDRYSDKALCEAARLCDITALNLILQRSQSMGLSYAKYESKCPMQHAIEGNMNDEAIVEMLKHLGMSGAQSPSYWGQGSTLGIAARLGKIGVVRYLATFHPLDEEFKQWGQN